MPKNKFQEVIFTIIMVFFMVYAMICYNISLNIGGMSNKVFLSAFHELVIMGPIAFILDFFIVSKLAFMCAARMVDFRNSHPFSKILAISVASVAFMCPLMSLAATILFKNAGSQFVAVWLHTTAMNFPMAFFWQLIYAGVRSYALFSDIFSEKMKLCRLSLHLLNKSDIKYFNTVNLPLATSIAYFGIKNLVCGDLRRLSA